MCKTKGYARKRVDKRKSKLKGRRREMFDEEGKREVVEVGIDVRICDNPDDCVPRGILLKQFVPTMCIILTEGKKKEL